jgi:hypothetical protein
MMNPTKQETTEAPDAEGAYCTELLATFEKLYDCTLLQAFTGVRLGLVTREVLQQCFDNVRQQTGNIA